MSCVCEGRGFVLKKGDYRTATGRIHHDVEKMVRCPGYVKYFDELESQDDPVIRRADVCPAASDRHAELQDKKRREELWKQRSGDDKRRRRRRGAAP